MSESPRWELSAAFATRSRLADWRGWLPPAATAPFGDDVAAKLLAALFAYLSLARIAGGRSVAFAATLLGFSGFYAIYLADYEQILKALGGEHGENAPEGVVGRDSVRQFKESLAGCRHSNDFLVLCLNAIALRRGGF